MDDVQVIEYFDGTKVWYKDDKAHREGGPAIELANGDKIWKKDGKIHRVGGPAIEYVNGKKHWYIDGSELTESEFKLISVLTR